MLQQSELTSSRPYIWTNVFYYSACLFRCRHMTMERKKKHCQYRTSADNSLRMGKGFWVRVSLHEIRGMVYSVHTAVLLWFYIKKTTQEWEEQIRLNICTWTHILE